MNKREQLACIVAGLHLTGDLEPPAQPSRAAYDVVDKLLAKLMEPGEGARKIMLQARAEYAGGTWDGMEAHCWKAMLTAIREGK